MLKTYKSGVLALFILSFIVGCAPLSPQKTAAEHQQELASTQERKTTLGLFQASIKEGMSQGDVATAVGSPNIVTQDSEGNDTWIYDKISTETSQSASSQQQDTSVGAGIGVFGTLLGGVVGASQSQEQASNASATSQSQKTLTVVIKFDKDRNVSSIRYQSSSF